MLMEKYLLKLLILLRVMLNVSKNDVYQWFKLKNLEIELKI